MNVCEHKVKVAPHEFLESATRGGCEKGRGEKEEGMEGKLNGHYLRLIPYIHSLLIEKDTCDRQNISIKFPCVCVCLSSGDLFNFW